MSEDRDRAPDDRVYRETEPVAVDPMEDAPEWAKRAAGGIYRGARSDEELRRDILAGADPDDCPTCGGSGGGPDAPLRCTACRGTGRRPENGPWSI